MVEIFHNMDEMYQPDKVLIAIGELFLTKIVHFTEEKRGAMYNLDYNRIVPILQKFNYSGEAHANIPSQTKMKDGGKVILTVKDGQILSCLILDKPGRAVFYDQGVSPLLTKLGVLGWDLVHTPSSPTYLNPGPMTPLIRGMTPPSGSMMRTRTGMVPAIRGVTPPGGMMHTHTGMVPAIRGMTPPPGGMMHTRTGMVPAIRGVTPPPGGMMHTRTGMVPAIRGVTPPPGGMMYATTGMMPAVRGMNPPPGGMIPPWRGYTDQQLHYLNRQPGQKTRNRFPRQRTVSQKQLRSWSRLRRSVYMLCDGTHNYEQIAILLSRPLNEIKRILDNLQQSNAIEE
jgi:hypothetical protein